MCIKRSSRQKRRSAGLERVQQGEAGQGSCGHMPRHLFHEDLIPAIKVRTVRSAHSILVNRNVLSGTVAG